MIWGLTYAEKAAQKVAKVRKRSIWFAWRPVQLEDDGRWIWWQKVKRIKGNCFENGSRCAIGWVYFLIK